MTTATVPPPKHDRITFKGVVASEWTKMRSVRSTYWSLLAAAITMIGLGILVCTVVTNRYDGLPSAERASIDPTMLSLRGLFFSQLIVGVLGVLIATSEYATGMIRTTLAAVPQRAAMLVAKVLVFTAVVLSGAMVVSFIAFTAGQAVLSRKSLQVSLGDPGVLRAVIGAALYLTVVGVLGIGIGFLLRSTGGALATLFGLLLVLPILAQVLPSDLRASIAKYLPGAAGQAILQVRPPDPAMFLEPWAGFALFCFYTLAVLAIATVFLKRRDA